MTTAATDSAAAAESAAPAALPAPAPVMADMSERDRTTIQQVRKAVVLGMRILLVTGTVTTWILVSLSGGYRFVAVLAVVTAVYVAFVAHGRRNDARRNPAPAEGDGYIRVPAGTMLVPLPPPGTAPTVPTAAAVTPAADLAGPLREAGPAAALTATGPVPAEGEAPCVPDRRAQPEIRQLITSLHHAADDLLAQNMQSTVAVEDLAHQVRAQLQLLSLRLDRLAGHVDSDGSSAHADARADVDRLNTILSEQMEFVRGAEGAAPIECDAVVTVRERLVAWSALADRHRLAPIESTLCDRAMVLTQQGVIGQVLDIVMDNALKYTPRDGGIRVTVTATSGACVVVVEDEGPGLTPAERVAATARGWRRDPETTDGCGLGLSIASVLVRSNRGTFELGEPANGRGLQVTFRFPLLTA